MQDADSFKVATGGIIGDISAGPCSKSDSVNAPLTGSRLLRPPAYYYSCGTLALQTSYSHPLGLVGLEHTITLSSHNSSRIALVSYNYDMSA
jgi:hypothetical protein